MAFKRAQKCKILLKLEILFLSIDRFDPMYLGDFFAQMYFVNSPRRPSLIFSPGFSEPKLDSPTVTNVTDPGFGNNSNVLTSSHFSPQSDGAAAAAQGCNWGQGRQALLGRRLKIH